MTPAEVRYFAAALARRCRGFAQPPMDCARSKGRCRSRRARPVEFGRRELLKGVTLYTADGGATDQKTLIIGFSGIHHRLMAPTSWLLDCLNPMLYDMIVLRDFSRRRFAAWHSRTGQRFLRGSGRLAPACRSARVSERHVAGDERGRRARDPGGNRASLESGHCALPARFPLVCRPAEGAGRRRRTVRGAARIETASLSRTGSGMRRGENGRPGCRGRACTASFRRNCGK